MCAHEFITASESDSHNALIHGDFLTIAKKTHPERLTTDVL
ncbi:hypothetical protein SAMN04487880_0133 [Marinobacter sp. es.042]|nr:hypothetical protein SAMN04487880_0133 [Marinobacter sp. es.042]